MRVAVAVVFAMLLSVPGASGQEGEETAPGEQTLPDGAGAPSAGPAAPAEQPGLFQEAAPPAPILIPDQPPAGPGGTPQQVGPDLSAEEEYRAISRGWQ
jgi:hypothetical protein